MNCFKMFQLLLPSLIARLLNNSPPSSLELSRNRWSQVAPIKDTCCCHAVNQWPSMPSWLTVRCHHVSMVLLKTGEEMRKYLQSKQAWVKNPVKPNMEPSAPHAGQRGQTDPFQSHSKMATFLHMPLASSQARSHYDIQTPKNTTCKIGWNYLFRQVLVISCHPGITMTIGKALTSSRDSKVAMQVTEWWTDHQERVNLLFEPRSLLGTHKNTG